MATPCKALLYVLCLLILSTSATSGIPLSLRRGLFQMASSKGQIDYITVPVPKASQEASQRLVSRGLPQEAEVASVVTLPSIDDNGKEVPRETLKVGLTGGGKRTVNRVPKKVNSPTSPLLPLQSTDTLARCNVAPPPFRTLPSFEDSGSLANGVTSLLYYKNNQIVAFCSGWLINPKRVVTAAHCAYDHNTRHYFWEDGESLKVSIGLNGKTSTDVYKSAFVTAVTMNKKFPAYSTWSQSLLDGTDTAVLKLSAPLYGKTYGWRSPQQGSARMVLGYPAASQTGFDQIGDIINSPTAAPSFGCAPGVGQNILCDNLSTEGGHSGSPIFFAYNADVVVGTLSGGKRGACPSLFTLAVPRTTAASSVTSLVQSSGCLVSTSWGVTRVSTCT